MTMPAKLMKQIDALNSTTLEAGELEAFFLKSRLSDLVRATRGVGNEQANSVFLDFCKQATTALRLHQESLSSSPSAPILLDYLLHAMIRYIDAVANTTSVELTATDRRQVLAEAFMMTGRKVSGASEQLRIEVCHAFNCSIQEQIGQTGALPTQKQLTTARRAAYRVYWGEEWIADEDTAKSRMKSIISLLQTEGFDPGKVTID